MRLDNAYNEMQGQLVEFTKAQFFEEPEDRREKEKKWIAESINKHPEETRSRLEAEFFGLGPLNLLLEDQDITEILVNGTHSIWYEKNGRLHRHDDTFFSEISYRNIFERLCQQCGGHMSLNHPYLETQFQEFRLTLIDGSLSQKRPLLSLRRHPKKVWTFERLQEQSWCNSMELRLLENLIRSKKNFLIIGETGSGKTSVANACLHLLPPNERAILIEDCAELILPNEASIKLLTREDPNGHVSTVTQQDLLKRSLRLRPDRLIMGEIRGQEAKDFLMMLSTGHAGSFATLHARDPQEALIRLEMLIQMGAPQWGLNAIRRLIHLSLHSLIVTERTSNGNRRFKGLYQIASLEDSGFTTEPVEDAKGLI